MQLLEEKITRRTKPRQVREQSSIGLPLGCINIFCCTHHCAFARKRNGHKYVCVYKNSSWLPAFGITRNIPRLLQGYPEIYLLFLYRGKCGGYCSTAEIKPGSFISFTAIKILEPHQDSSIVALPGLGTACTQEGTLHVPLAAPRLSVYIPALLSSSAATKYSPKNTLSRTKKCSVLIDFGDHRIPVIQKCMSLSVTLSALDDQIGEGAFINAKTLLVLVG